MTAIVNRVSVQPIQDAITHTTELVELVHADNREAKRVAFNMCSASFEDAQFGSLIAPPLVLGQDLIKRRENAPSTTQYAHSEATKLSELVFASDRKLALKLCAHQFKYLAYCLEPDGHSFLLTAPAAVGKKGFAFISGENYIRPGSSQDLAELAQGSIRAVIFTLKGSDQVHCLHICETLEGGKDNADLLDGSTSLFAAMFDLPTVWILETAEPVSYHDAAQKSASGEGLHIFNANMRSSSPAYSKEVVESMVIEIGKPFDLSPLSNSPVDSLIVVRSLERDPRKFSRRGPKLSEPQFSNGIYVPWPPLMRAGIVDPIQI